jgi:general secretion pathway protein C
MGLDATLKRYSPVILCLMIALCAYFQASGINHLLGAAVLGGAARPSFGAPRPPRAQASDPDHETGADAILDRNVFDSVTGPIPRVPGGPGAPKRDNGWATQGEDPYADPPCTSERALLIAGSDDASWSFAAIAGADGKTTLRRRGEEIDGQTVFFVGDMRPEEHRHEGEPGLWDRVWLAGPAGRCQLALGAKGPAAKAPAQAPPPGAPEGSLASKIRRNGDRVEVDRSTVEAIINNPAELMKTKIFPVREGDRVVGMRLMGVRPGSVFDALGLANGDQLTAINGFEMNDPQKMLEAYTKLMHADHLGVSVVRGGKPMNVDIDIK